MPRVRYLDAEPVRLAIAAALTGQMSVGWFQALAETDEAGRADYELHKVQRDSESQAIDTGEG